jgi:branched-subunit amino acid ABC-type transport system permease component
MKALLEFIIVGLVSGSLYGLAAMGLVLTYKTTGVFNFAHGAVAAAAAFAFYQLRDVNGLPWPVALVLAVGGFGLLAGTIIGRLSRRLSDIRPELEVVATVGLLLLIQGFIEWHFGAATKPFREFLPTRTVDLAGVAVRYGQIITVAIAAAAAVFLFVLLRYTRLGMRMRALVSDPSLLGMTGASATRVRTLAWVIGCSFAALSGILIAPALGLDASLLTLLVVQAFGAAAIGLFTSLPLTYLGGLVIGVGASLLTRYVNGTSQAILGLPSALPFIVLFAMLILAPKRRLSRGPARTRPPTPPPIRVPPRVAVAGAAVTTAVAAAVPLFVGAKLPVFITAVSFVPLFLSLALLLHLSGQISLCHAAFAAFGATTFSHLTHGMGVPWVPALLLSAAAVVPLGAAVAIPAIRLSGVYLALATFGLGILMQRVAFGTALMFGGRGYRSAPRPSFATSDRTFYLLALAVAVVCAALVTLVVRSRLGRLLRALGDSPTALGTQGLDVNTTRTLVFCLSAAVAGLAGALFIAAPGQASGTGFGPFQSLTWLAVLAICGRRVVFSSALAAAVLVVLPAYLPSSLVHVQTMLFGGAAIVAALLSDGALRPNLEEANDRIRRSAIRARGRTRLTRLEAL